MTNHENLSNITGINESVEDASVKSLLAKIWDDYERGVFEDRYDYYLEYYNEFKKWLESEVRRFN